MTTLETLPLRKRVVLAAAIVFGVLLWLALVSRSPSAARDIPLYDGVPLDAALLQMDKQALNDAYRQQLVHLFNIWLKGQATSTKEISNGLRIARESYYKAVQQIAEREQQLPKAKPD